MSVMGVDVGTTGVKAVVFSDSGRILAGEYEEYPLLFPFPGAAELDTEAVMAAALRVIGAAAHSVRPTDPVTAIGVASQGEAFAPVTSDGRMTANVMTSSDTRAQRLVGPWSEGFGAARLYEITGHTPYPMYSLYKLLWLRDERPEAWETAWKFLFVQDLVAYALTGDAATDYTMAARSMLFDVRRKAWSPEVLEALGLDESRLPRVLPSGGVVGTVLAGKADTLGLDSTVTVSVCGHDQPVGALGCSAARPGRAAYSIGTVECICPAVGEAVLSPGLMSANLATYPHVLPGNYTTVVFNMTGGSVLRWFRDQVATSETAAARAAGADVYDSIIATAAPKPANVILLPHFGPTGTPYFDPNGAGALFGLKLSTQRSEIVRAFLEGITYEMRLNLSILSDAGIGLSDLRAVGGGARSDRWMQIKADILGIPLTTMEAKESTCMGAAILAGGGRGMWDPADMAESWAHPIRTYEPSAEAASYHDRFALYRELYNSLGRARAMLSNLS